MSVLKAARGKIGAAFQAAVSMYEKAAPKRKPRMRQTYTYGCCQPTTTAWFQAKLMSTRAATPLTMPGTSSTASAFRMPHGCRGCLSALSGDTGGMTHAARTATATSAMAWLQYTQGHHASLAKSPPKRKPAMAPKGADAPNHAKDMFLRGPDA